MGLLLDNKVFSRRWQSAAFPFFPWSWSPGGLFLLRFLRFSLVWSPGCFFLLRFFLSLGLITPFLCRSSFSARFSLSRVLSITISSLSVIYRGLVILWYGKILWDNKCFPWVVVSHIPLPSSLELVAQEVSLFFHLLFSPSLVTPAFPLFFVLLCCVPFASLLTAFLPCLLSGSGDDTVSCCGRRTWSAFARAHTLRGPWSRPMRRVYSHISWKSRGVGSLRSKDYVCPWLVLISLLLLFSCRFLLLSFPAFLLLLLVFCLFCHYGISDYEEWHPHDTPGCRDRSVGAWGGTKGNEP